jgi:hypothetical protein
MENDVKIKELKEIVSKEIKAAKGDQDYAPIFLVTFLTPELEITHLNNYQNNCTVYY